jgi:hypothetical protein
VLPGLKHIYKRLLGFTLLILFTGYFGSITFFPHTHIVDGIHVVHSHPFPNGKIPLTHNHSKNGFILIQFVSNFIASAPVLLIVCATIRVTPDIRFLINNVEFTPDTYLFSYHRARAPTFRFSL